MVSQSFSSLWQGDQERGAVLSKRVYIRSTSKPQARPVYERRVVYRLSRGCIPGGWHVHHIDGNHGNNEPTNLVALPLVIHRALRARRLLPSLAACRAMVAWWKATHPETRRRKAVVTVATIAKRYRLKESAVGRAERVAEYLAKTALFQ